MRAVGRARLRAKARWGVSTSVETKANGKLPRKVNGEVKCARTKTDTGRQGEDPKVSEKTLVKELGKMHP